MDILQFLEKGGTIVYILIALNIIGFTIIFMELFNLYNFKKNIQTTVQTILAKVQNNHEDLLEMIIQQEIKKLEFGLNTIKIIATISPLLGLLGTVVGIFASFDVISKIGLDDPMNFSGGISLALITTIVGLIVSIPHYIFYNYFIGTLDNMEITLKSEVLCKL
ncbi:MAG: MotA/TolQ/ExbB proton channel family protein [Arcobacteraceae bacterium]|jgi:biopolymer transport protein ExbB|nr:MotA/TolQ/ExbB proton channel family protein [Arcobacteraceae bacterium]